MFHDLFSYNFTRNYLIDSYCIRELAYTYVPKIDSYNLKIPICELLRYRVCEIVSYLYFAGVFENYDNMSVSYSTLEDGNDLCLNIRFNRVCSNGELVGLSLVINSLLFGYSDVVDMGFHLYRLYHVWNKVDIHFDLLSSGEGSLQKLSFLLRSFLKRYNG